MRFDYYPVGSSTPVSESVSALELAKYIASDWMPGVPPESQNALATVLRSVLRPVGARWCVSPDLAFTDRQWKGTTSWILGVAFARFVIEKESYPFWLPVSACTPSTSPFRPDTGEWTTDRAREWHTVYRSSDARSRFLPDYLVCRQANDGTFEYAFVESKGTARRLSNLTDALPKWVNQVNNAELEYRGRPESVARRLIVATRVNPGVLGEDGRAIVVRAWNRSDQAESDDSVRFALFLAAHYAGLCRRLGLDDYAESMIQAGLRIEARLNALHPAGAHPRTERGFEARGPLLSYEPNDRISHDNMRELPIRRATNRHARFLLGDGVFEVALTRPALDIMQAIDSGDAVRAAAVAFHAVQYAREFLDYHRRHSDNRVAVTLNGVAVFDTSLLTLGQMSRQ
jgi:hypothetical protein